MKYCRTLNSNQGSLLGWLVRLMSGDTGRGVPLLSGPVIQERGNWVAIGDGGKWPTWVLRSGVVAVRRVETQMRLEV